MIISKQNTKLWHSRSVYPIRIKIRIDNQPIEQVSHFSYWDCDISYHLNNDLSNKLRTYKYIWAQYKTRKDTYIKILKDYGSISIIVQSCEN